MHRIHLRAALALVLVAGCGESPRNTTTSALGRNYTEAMPSAAVKTAEQANFEPPTSLSSTGVSSAYGNASRRSTRATNTPADKSNVAALGLVGGATNTPADKTGVFASDATAVPIDRKIIYNADISVIVEDFAKAEPQVVTLVKRAGGYVAEMQIAGSPGAQRSGTWRVRIPVEAFESFLVDVTGLGELERNHRTSQDVSEEFYDIEARIKNKRVEEERLVQILKETTGKIEDVLRIETELSRVRGEIEQMEGRIRVLANLTSLTTVTIAIHEREKYQPPPPVAASFGTQIERTFHESMKSLENLGKAIVLWLVDWALWLPIILVGLLVAWLVGRVVVRVLIRLGRRAWQIGQTPVLPP